MIVSINLQSLGMKKKISTVSRPLPVWLRFYLYGMHGLLDEIVFTAVFDLLFEPEGNWHLKGYTTLFSFLIYGSCSTFAETVYVRVFLKNGIRWHNRMLLYLCFIYTWEFVFGLILRQFDACSWDYSHYPLNLMGLVTLVYAPVWLVISAYQDMVFKFLLSLRITTEVHGENGNAFKLD